MPKAKSKKLYDKVVDHVLFLIQSGELCSGDQLPTEKELALQMGVSKTAVREAMSALESMGYTRSRVGEGTFVSDVTLDSLILPVSMVLSQDEDVVDNLMELRVILETRSAELAAQRLTPANATLLRDNLDTMRQAVEFGGNAIEIDEHFHTLLARCTGNSVFCRLFEMCHSVMVETISMVLNYPGQARIAYESHVRIFDAVKSGDSTKAAIAMRKHLEQNFLMIRKIEKGKADK